MRQAGTCYSRTPDTFGLQAAFDPLMPAAVPFTVLIAPNGDIVFQELGEVEHPQVAPGHPGQFTRRRHAPGPASLLVCTLTLREKP